MGGTRPLNRQVSDSSVFPIEAMKTQLLRTLITLTLLTGCVRTPPQIAVQTYAVLPFDVTIEKNLQVKKTTPEQLSQQARQEAYQYQNGTFQYLMSRKREFAVDFQDIDETNTLLSRAGLTYEKIRTMTKGELSQLLQVDGILTGKFSRKENLPRGAARALDLVAANTNVLGLGVKQGEASLSLSLYNAAERRVVWTYQNEDWNSSYRSPEELAGGLMERAARKFPYKN
jgi:hypothetical protein